MEMRDTIGEAIYEHAQKDFPNECVGLVMQDGTTVPLVNTSDDPEHAFAIDPCELFDYIHRAEFLYHSHPNRSAEPSNADVASCNNIRLPYLIMSVPSGETARIVPLGMDLQLLGRPFVYGVSDCFSLIEDFYLQKLGIKLPPFIRPKFGWWKTGGNVIEENISRAGFEVVHDVLQFGDVLLMEAGGCNVLDHMAVYIGDQQIMHHTLMGLSRVSPLDGYWKTITKKVIRHEHRG